MTSSVIRSGERVKTFRDRQACMKRVMLIEVAREVCKDHAFWYTVSTKKRVPKSMIHRRPNKNGGPTLRKMDGYYPRIL